ncbi:HNH endonuclease [Microbacterium sp. KUDC0406]|uniref:HNH endonuclease signature motif containing protein n=1 Tax=Microbacterium sp. KUDC0406 TaxID=2909588 RepID=UPI001F2A7C61|nr:HNH endonuclease signature motif containing protein [Microbacterium sp. KUDC0406]UJP10872.1 HNH endonuclease [Microbacterium sp. KUDC0406]
MTADVFPDLEQRTALLDAWVRTRRGIARLEAEASGLLAERMRVFEADGRANSEVSDVAYRSMVSEYAAAGHLAKMTTQSAFADAAALDADFPAVREALREGRLTPAHVREICRAGAIVREAVMNGTADADALDVFAEAAVKIAEADSPGRTRPQVQAVAATIAQVTLRERHAKAAEERCVSIQLLDDGLARLVAVLPEYLAVAIYDRLTRITRKIAQETRKAENEATTKTGDAEADATEADAGAGIPDDVWADDESTGEDDEWAGGNEERPGEEWNGDEWNGDEEWAAAAYAKADDQDLAPWDDGYHDDVPDAWADRDAEDDLAVQLDLAASVHAGILDPDVACPNLIPEWMITEVHHDRAPSPPGPPPTPPHPAPRAGNRTYDQIRADILTDLLLSADPSDMQGTGLDNITGHIQVTIAATTLTGANDLLAELDGHGPLHPDLARNIASRNTGWTRLFLNPTGMITETDTYTPTESMKKFLRARDEHCRFPGCRLPATSCEIDHNHDYALGGRTTIDNLTHLCPGHHALKHPDLHDKDRWTARLLDDGSLSWTSPLGRNYTDPPTRRVMFT